MEENEQVEKKSGKTGRTFFIIILVAIVLIAGIAAITVVLSGKASDKDRNRSSEADASASLEIGEAREYSEKNSDGTLTPVEIAEKVRPSVMGVIVYNGHVKTGEGSGIFMSEDESGTYTYVLTCAHVIDESGASFKIELEDGSQYDAEVVGYDKRTDVGVLRVKATGFTLAEFGDSSVLKVGEPVYAIGNPGGTKYYGSFTGGYVSAIGRLTSSEYSSYSNVSIQHDAAISPGNSGGALVNSFGQVVGINSSKIVEEYYEGINFAVPSKVFTSVVNDLLTSGHVTQRAKLGISYLEASTNESYARVVNENNLPNGTIIIADIDVSSSLYGTEVKKGDLIIGVNGKDLTRSDIIVNIIDNSKPGDKLELTVVHVNSDYSIEKFKVTSELVEDTATGVSSEAGESGEDTFENPFADPDN